MFLGMSVPFYSLGVRDIIETADFFLKKIIEFASEETEMVKDLTLGELAEREVQNPPKYENLNFYLFGFIVASDSIPDYLLHECYVHFFHEDLKIRSHAELMSVTYRINESKFCDECCRTGNMRAMEFMKFWFEKKKKLDKDSSIKFLHALRNIAIHRKFVTKPHVEFIRNGKWNFGFMDKNRKPIEKDGIGFCNKVFEKMCQFVDEIKRLEKN